VFAFLSFVSFYSIWYWVLTVVVWTLACHRTLGVPYDMVLRARRLPEVAEDVDRLAAIHAERVAHIYRRSGAVLAGVGGFALAALATLGFGSWNEAAQATFVLLLPLSGVGFATGRLALALRGSADRGEALRRRLSRRRFWNQVIAILAIFAAAALALLHHPALVVR
jgi:hypothetical protein